LLYEEEAEAMNGSEGEERGAVEAEAEERSEGKPGQSP
jgi:hypothetical protein